MTERRETNLFDLMGEPGIGFQEAEKPKDAPPTEGAVKLAEKEKIDLKEVKGTGQNGRIVQSDVQKVVTQRAAERARKNQQQNAGKKEPDVYDKDRIARYAGQAIEVPTREMKLEDVRAMLEETFPELSKERTEMLYDEEKGLVIPVLKGHRKGTDGMRMAAEFLGLDAATPKQPIAVHREVPTDSAERPVFFMLGRDGVYEVRQTQAGQFVARVDSGRDIREGLVMRTPPIPVDLLRHVVGQFRVHSHKEKMANIIYDRTGLYAGTTGEPGYLLDWPEQEGSASTVSALGMMETDDLFIVLQLHSHGAMRAFFSGTDDADEVRTGLYAVVGECEKDRPEMLVRYSVGGTYRLIGPHDMYRMPLFNDFAALESIVEVRSVYGERVAQSLAAGSGPVTRRLEQEGIFRD